VCRDGAETILGRAECQDIQERAECRDGVEITLGQAECQDTAELQVLAELRLRGHRDIQATAVLQVMSEVTERADIADIQETILGQAEYQDTQVLQE